MPRTKINQKTLNTKKLSLERAIMRRDNDRVSELKKEIKQMDCVIKRRKHKIKKRKKQENFKQKQNTEKNKRDQILSWLGLFEKQHFKIPTNIMNDNMNIAGLEFLFRKKTLQTIYKITKDSNFDQIRTIVDKYLKSKGKNKNLDKNKKTGGLPKINKPYFQKNSNLKTKKEILFIFNQLKIGLRNNTDDEMIQMESCKVKIKNFISNLFDKNNDGLVGSSLKPTNMVVSGQIGSGKTLLLKKIKSILENKYNFVKECIRSKTKVARIKTNVIFIDCKCVKGVKGFLILLLKKMMINLNLPKFKLEDLKNMNTSDIKNFIIKILTHNSTNKCYLFLLIDNLEEFNFNKKKNKNLFEEFFSLKIKNFIKIISIQGIQIMKIPNCSLILQPHEYSILTKAIISKLSTILKKCDLLKQYFSLQSFDLLAKRCCTYSSGSMGDFINDVVIVINQKITSLSLIDEPNQTDYQITPKFINEKINGNRMDLIKTFGGFNIYTRLFLLSLYIKMHGNNFVEFRDIMENYKALVKSFGLENPCKTIIDNSIDTLEQYSYIKQGANFSSYQSFLGKEETREFLLCFDELKRYFED